MIVKKRNSNVHITSIIQQFLKRAKLKSQVVCKVAQLQFLCHCLPSRTGVPPVFAARTVRQYRRYRCEGRCSSGGSNLPARLCHCEGRCFSGLKQSPGQIWRLLATSWYRSQRTLAMTSLFYFNNTQIEKQFPLSIFGYNYLSEIWRVKGCSFHNRAVSRSGSSSQGRLRAVTTARCGVAWGPAISSPMIMKTSANIIPE